MAEIKDTFVDDVCVQLVRMKVISDKEADALKKTFAESSHDNFEEFLLDEGFVERAELLHALSLHYKVPSFDCDGFFFNCQLLRQFPKDFLVRNGIIPVEVDENMLFVVASDPEAEGLESQMRNYVSYEIEFFVGIKRDIWDSIRDFYDKSLTEDVEMEDADIREEERDERDALERDDQVQDLSYGDNLYHDDDDQD
jgi:hypothetical protein